MINVLIWLLIGAVAGFAAGRLTRTFQQGVPIVQIVAGSIGALLGGVIFLIFDTSPLQLFSVGGVLFALIGAIVAIGLVQVTVGRMI